MAKLKALLLAHGEKALLGVVLVVSLWSVLGNLLGEKGRLPGGEPVDPARINSRLERIEERIRAETTDRDMPVADTSAEVERILAAYGADAWTPGVWESPYYARPAPPFSPKEYIPPTESLAPPPQYISRIDQPSDMRVYAGGQRIVIVWREGEDTQWRGGVKGALWRKVLGAGRENAPWEAVRKRQAIRHEGGDAEAADEGAPTDGGPRFGEDDPVLGGLVTEEEPEAPAPAPDEAEEEPAAVDALDPAAVAAAERAAIEEREEILAADREALLDPNGVIETKWKLLGRDLQGYRERPDVDLLLEEGVPGDEELARWGPADTHASTDADERLWFFYVDEALEENTVYRYKSIVYAGPLDLPDAVRLDEEGEPRDGYKYYAPILRQGRTRLALPRKDFIEQLRELDGEPSLRAPARPLEFQPLVRMEEVVDATPDVEDAPVVWFAFPFDTPKEKLQALSEAPQFSQFQWSDYVLTPVRTRIVYTSDAGRMAFLKVFITDALGEQLSRNFQIQAPEAPENTEKAYFDPADQMRARAIYPPDRVTPAPIGEVKQMGTEERDFRTGWGLVDIRDCTILVRRYRLTEKRDDRDRPVLDATGEPVMEKQVISEREWKHKYIVVRELEGERGRPPRFRAILKRKRTPGPEDVRVELEVIDWNPGVEPPRSEE